MLFLQFADKTVTRLRNCLSKQLGAYVKAETPFSFDILFSISCICLGRLQT